MPANKNALARYRVIDDCLTNNMNRYPRLPDLIKKIGEKLGQSISDSMVNKDLRAMKELYGAPIRFNRERGGYEYEQEGFSIREFPLTYEEIEAMDLAPAMLQQLRGTGLYEQFLHAVNKVIEGYRIGKALGKDETEIIQMETGALAPGTEWLEVLLKAIIEKKSLEIEYQSYGGTTKLHHVSGYLLKEYRNRWYLVGHSDRSDAVIVYGLDRIKSVSPSQKHFYQDAGFSSVDYFRYSFGITQMHYQEPEEVILSFQPEQAPYILSQPVHTSQKILVHNDIELRIRIKVYRSHELLQFIMGNLDKILDIEPASLKEEIKERVGKALDRLA